MISPPTAPPAKATADSAKVQRMASTMNRASLIPKERIIGGSYRLSG